METFSALLALSAENSPVTGEFPSQKPVTRSFGVFFIRVWINGWVNNRDASDLRRYRGHYDVTVMCFQPFPWVLFSALRRFLHTGISWSNCDDILWRVIWNYVVHQLSAVNDEAFVPIVKSWPFNHSLLCIKSNLPCVCQNILLNI